MGVVAPSVRIAPASHSQLADATTEHRTVLEAQRSASEAKIATHAEATDAAERRARSRDAELEEAQLKLATALQRCAPLRAEAAQLALQVESLAARHAETLAARDAARGGARAQQVAHQALLPEVALAAAEAAAAETPRAGTGMQSRPRLLPGS